jgi:DNA modification methylase
MEASKVLVVPIDKIKIGVRRRVDLGDLDKLQSSIARVGLLNAIIIDSDYELVAGFRRLTCCKNLGFVDIIAMFKDDLSPLQKKELELEENTYKELSWDEVASLRADIHKIKQELYGKPVKGHATESWSVEDTAQSLGLSVGTLSQDLTLADSLAKYPNLRKFTSKRQAVSALVKARETTLLSELARRDAEKSLLKISTPYLLHNGDSRIFLKENVEDETVDLVFFDPPWGIDIDVVGTSRGLGGTKTSYKDDGILNAKIFTEEVLVEIYRVMKNNTHMYMFVGSEFLNYWIDFLSNTRTVLVPGDAPRWEVLDEKREWKFDVRKVPLIWVKEGGGYTDFEVRFMPRYETILFCNKGIRRLNSVCSDVFEFKRPPSTERVHTQQKSTELIQQLIRLSSQPNELILDPCAGSFVSVVAATLTGRRSIGIEKDVNCYNAGINWVKAIKQEDIETNDIREE